MLWQGLEEIVNVGLVVGDQFLAVNQDVDFLAGVFGEYVVYVVRIEVVASDVAFEVELVLGIFCHILDEYGAKILYRIMCGKDWFKQD